MSTSDPAQTGTPEEPTEVLDAGGENAQTEAFGAPDSYGVPDSAEYLTGSLTQPFPHSEPDAFAPLGDFELVLPADEPEVGAAEAPLEGSAAPGAVDLSKAPVQAAGAPEPPTAVLPTEPPPADVPPTAYAPPAAFAATAYSVAASEPAIPAPAPAPYDAQPAGYPPAPTYGAPSYPQQPYAAQQPYAPYPPQQPYAQPGGYPAYGQAPFDPYAKSRVVAGVLGILLGGLGVHRFYLGFVGIGILQIVVTIVTAGLGALWGFVEGILYLTQRTGSYSVDATGRPLRD